jgi:branched-chain amino acid transport system substrate-binding protein
VGLLVLGAVLSSCRSNDAAKAEAEPASGSPAAVSDAIKVGLLAPSSGPFASLGAQIEGGVKAYLDRHGGVLDGRKVELLVRDTTGVAPDVAKRLAQGSSCATRSTSSPALR